jgi:hypothetical protein
MALEPYTQFKATTNINNTLLMEEMEHSIEEWLKWSLLRIGAWQDVDMESSGYFGGDFHTLSRVVDPSYDEYQVWETPVKVLVYESGVNFNGNENPVEISGVWINGAFYEPDDITYGHYVDYPNGRVVFNTALTSDDIVEMNYSYRTVTVEIAGESDRWKEIPYGSRRVDNPHRVDPDKGQWAAIPALKRIKLPAIVIEAVARGTNKGYQLGSQALVTKRDVLFHIVAEDRRWRNRLSDIVLGEQEQTIWLFNSDNIVGTQDWPVDYRGAKNDSGLTYPELIDKYKWLRMRIDRMVLAEVENLNPYLHEGTVRGTMEIIYTKD